MKAVFKFSVLISFNVNLFYFDGAFDSLILLEGNEACCQIKQPLKSEVFSRNP